MKPCVPPVGVDYSQCSCFNKPYLTKRWCTCALLHIVIKITPDHVIILQGKAENDLTNTVTVLKLWQNIWTALLFILFSVDIALSTSWRLKIVIYTKMKQANWSWINSVLSEFQFQWLKESGLSPLRDVSALSSWEYSVGWWTAVIIDSSVSLCQLRSVRHSVVCYKTSIIITPEATFQQITSAVNSASGNAVIEQI